MYKLKIEYQTQNFWKQGCSSKKNLLLVDQLNILVLRSVVNMKIRLVP